MSENKNPLLSLALILGASLIISAIIGGVSFYKVRSLDNTLAMTGSAKKAVRSDKVKWRANFTRVALVDNLKTGYTQMKTDQAAVAKFFRDSGIADKNISISAVLMDQNYKYNYSGPAEYTLRQNVDIESDDVDKITKLTKNIQSLIDQGVIFSTLNVEYYYSKLPELRVELLGEAVKDAQARGSKIAESSGKRLGALKSASGGVVQVLAPNSTDVSDYGAYDTATIEKEVMVAVRATFVIK
ncbi:SIMPL domain-containing protein [Patescibacteria group bacterium]|nr:MAG: SIMPL domain-containing protein [Patescibacteria group bacterium]